MLTSRKLTAYILHMANLILHRAVVPDWDQPRHDTQIHASLMMGHVDWFRDTIEGFRMAYKRFHLSSLLWKNPQSPTAKGFPLRNEFLSLSGRIPLADHDICEGLWKKLDSSVLRCPLKQLQ